MGGTEDRPAGAGGSDEEPDLAVESVEFPADLPAGSQRRLIANEERSARRGSLLGGLVILAGIVLLILGVSGSVDFSFAGGRTSGHLITGSLGVVVVVVGGAIVWVTRHQVKVTSGNSTPR